MPKLIIVPTPVGNLKDITYRAIDVLKNVNYILAEDTRKTRNLLQHYGIKTPVRPYHQANEHKIYQKICVEIKAGIEVALVSNAGTPAISDPGYLIINQCIQNKIRIECLPGATAFVPALVSSGLPCERFCFEGFLPRKKGRKTRLEELSMEKRTIVIYESPKRLLKTLTDLISYFGKDRQASVARELTKIFEEYIRGTLDEIYQHFSVKEIKGEIIIVVKGKSKR